MINIVIDPLEQSVIKQKLTKELAKIIDANGWTQQETANILGIDQPKVSKLKRGFIKGFSTERLLIFLSKTGCKIAISLNY